MDITIAYFHPFLHPDHVKRDFERIRAAGGTSIVYAIHEHEGQRWLRDLARGLQQAHDAGLKVYISPGCYGNLFAGPSLAPSWYTFHHPESRVKDRHGRSHNMTCYNYEPFRSWLFKEITFYLTDYPINGVLIDQPRGSDITCFCSVCRALCPDITDLQHFRRRSMIDFFGKFFTHIKTIDEQARTAIALLPHELDLIEDLAQLPSLDMLGCHLFWQLLHEDMTKMEEWGQMVVRTARKYEKRSQLWLQNFSLDEQDEKTLEPSFNKLLCAEPDEVACYYYWRNNANPEYIWQTTSNLLRRIPRRQLYWRYTPPSLPVITISHNEAETSSTLDSK